MAQNQVKFPVPRQLEENETVVTLGQWKNQFTIYAKRDPVFATFLSISQPNMGFISDNILADATKAANCDLLINHVASFLKTPYWNKRILERHMFNFSELLRTANLFLWLFISDWIRA